MVGASPRWVVRATSVMVLAALVGTAPVVVGVPAASAGAPGYTTLGQPDLAAVTLASRCDDPNARFGQADADQTEMYGPSGIAVDPRGRVFVTDFGGQRLLTWRNFEAMQACSPADGVIGAGILAGPEAVAVDTSTGNVFVADTLSHTVRGFRRSGGNWRQFVVLGTDGVPGDGFGQFNFPRGLGFDGRGRLFVADDFNNRVLIFDPPVRSGQEAADSIGGGADGGLSGPKGLAVSGNTVYVADYQNDRVLRFTGPFLTPDEVYAATATFTGLDGPVDVAVHPDGSLLVTDQLNQRIARYDNAAWAPSSGPTSTFADEIGPEPLGVAADRNGRIYIADYRRFRVLIRQERLAAGPVTAGSTSGAQALLRDLRRRPDRAADRVAIGQQLRTSEYGPRGSLTAWYGDWLQLERRNLPLPEIMGGELSDLMSYPGFAPNQRAFNELLRHGRAGHPVTINWHPSNPVAGAAFGDPISTADLQSVVDDGTEIGDRWQEQLDRAAAVLRQFADAGVPVLFRPLHEQNGNFFWWGDAGGTGAAASERQAAWVAMWRDMVTELTVRRGLGNLLFVFGTNQVNYDQVVPPLTYYPGADWVDVVSIDVYDDELDLAGGQRGLQHYAALVGTGKPFGISEFGQAFDDNGTGPDAARWDARTVVRRVRNSYPRTAFAIAWYSSVEGTPPTAFVFALPDVAFTPALLRHRLIDTQ